VVLGLDGSRLVVPTVASPASEPEPAVAALVEPPGDLPVDQQAVWRRFAAHAVAQGTLVPATVPGFRELCEQMTFKDAIAAKIAKAPAGRRSDGPLRHYVKLAQRVDATLARYKLTAFGKPAERDKGGKTGKANPFAAVAA